MRANPALACPSHAQTDVSPSRRRILAHFAAGMHIPRHGRPLPLAPLGCFVYSPCTVVFAVEEASRPMKSQLPRQMLPGLLVSATLLGAVVYLSGLVSTLEFGDAHQPGMLLLPILPTPLYLVMAVIILGGVSITVLATLRQRRRRMILQEPPANATLKSPWHILVSTLATWLLLLAGAVWFLRHGDQLQSLWERFRTEVGLAQEMLETGTHALVQHVHSPTTGYAMFLLVVVVYGGLGILGLWMLCEGRGLLRFQADEESGQARQVQRAVAAGLRELRTHTDPRQAIIACYARLEHLLEEYGVPASPYLTPQEYMGRTLRDLDLPAEAFAGLVGLFELARYSLHPVDDTARSLALEHLTRLNAHLEGNMRHATAV